VRVVARKSSRCASSRALSEPMHAAEAKDMSPARHERAPAALRAS
jgi:hypothetical protein